MEKTGLVALALAMCLAAAPAVAQNNGAALFSQNCARCHGEDGSAKTGSKMHVANLRSDAVQKQSDNELLESIGRGVRHKQYPHSFLLRGMTEAQVRSIIAHIRTFKSSGK